MSGSARRSHFRLLLYFLIASAVALLAVTIIPAVAYRVSAIDDLVRSAEAANGNLARSLANSIWLRYADELGEGADAAKAPEVAGTMRDGVARLTAGLPVALIRIHRPDGQLVFSTDPADANQPRPAEPGVGTTVATRLPTSTLDFHGLEANAGRYMVESYIPIPPGAPEVRWVFELHVDVTETVGAVDRNTRRLILVLVACLGAAYAGMSLLVRRADRILAAQYRDLAEAERSLREQNLRLFNEVEERRKAEAAAAVAESRKTFILESALEAVITIDDRRQTVEYNKAAQAIFGYPREEVIGKDVAALIVPDDQRDAHHSAFTRYVATGTGRTDGRPFQVTGLRRGGQEFPLEIAITSFELGERRYFTAFMRDVTDRVAAEKSRDEGERALLDVIEASPVAVGITDRLGRFLFWNPQFYQMGRTYRDDKGKNNFGLVFTTPGLHRTLLDRIETESRILNEEAELLVGERETAWVLVSLQSMVFEGQAAVLTWLYDITALKAQERALMDARIEAEKGSRAKSEFLATMSHEIRTPMNGVMTMADILDQTDLTEGQRAMTTIIRDSAAALLGIIDDVLDFSKIEAGRLLIENVSMSLNQVAEGVADLLGPRAAEKGLDLVAYIDPETPDHLIGDPTRVRQILLNLIGNAIKFTERGSIMTRVKAEAVDGEVATLLFEIEDTGIGIPLAMQEKLFRPFVQGDSSTVRRFGGTGLGLSICRTLVELMGGEIGFSSPPGQGSTFWFRLPFALAPERRHPLFADVTGLAVLVVTPNHNLSGVARSYLEAGGAEVVVADSAAAALPILRQQAGSESPFTVVLADADAGDMAGLSLSQAIAAAPALGRPRVVLMLPKMSAFAFMDTRRETLFTTLSKPVHRVVLCHVIAAAGGRVPLQDPGMPARRRTDQARMTFTAPSPEEALATGNLILVAEDNPTNQTVIRMLLERLGYAADVAENGVEAWAMLKRKPYGLLLTDCHMPEMDGYELARTVRDNEVESTSRRLPIIALTADAVAGTAERCSASGMDGYLKKPVAWQELDRTILRWLPGAGKLRKPQLGPREAAPTPPPPPPPAKPVASPPAEPVAPPPAEAPPPVLDPAYLLELLGGAEEMLAPMLDEYLTTTRPLVDELIAAIAAGDYEVARKKAHSCAGASKTAGAMHFAGICGNIEKAVVAKDLNIVSSEGALVAAAFDKVAEAVKAVPMPQA